VLAFCRLYFEFTSVKVRYWHLSLDTCHLCPLAFWTFPSRGSHTEIYFPQKPFRWPKILNKNFQFCSIFLSTEVVLGKIGLSVRSRGISEGVSGGDFGEILVNTFGKFSLNHVSDVGQFWFSYITTFEIYFIESILFSNESESSDCFFEEVYLVSLQFSNLFLIQYRDFLRFNIISKIKNLTSLKLSLPKNFFMSE